MNVNIWTRNISNYPLPHSTIHLVILCYAPRLSPLLEGQ